jgi:hypothetical protein
MRRWTGGRRKTKAPTAGRRLGPMSQHLTHLLPAKWLCESDRRAGLLASGHPTSRAFPFQWNSGLQRVSSRLQLRGSGGFSPPSRAPVRRSYEVVKGRPSASLGIVRVDRGRPRICRRNPNIPRDARRRNWKFRRASRRAAVPHKGRGQERPFGLWKKNAGGGVFPWPRERR